MQRKQLGSNSVATEATRSRDETREYGFQTLQLFSPPFQLFYSPVILSEVEDKLGFGRPGGRGIWLADVRRSSPSPRFIDDNSIDISIGVQRRGKSGVR